MPGVTEQMLTAVREKESEAARAYAAAVKLQEEMVAAGVNLLTDNENFEKLNAKYAEHGVLAQEAETMKDRLAQLQGFDVKPAGSAFGATPRLPAPGGGGRSDTIFTLGARLTDSELYKRAQKMAQDVGDASFSATLKDAFAGGIGLVNRAELMAMVWGRYGATAITGGSATSAGPFVQNDLQPGFVEYIRERPLLASVVGRGETDSDVVEYVTQSAPTNSAAPTAETNNAAESTYPFATATTNVQEIVHYVPVTRRAMADAGQIRTIIENDLVLDALVKMDSQIASGLGTGDELEGIYTAVTQAQAVGADSRPDALLKAMTQIRVAAGVLMEPDFIGIHPNDYQDVLLETDGQGRHLMGPPSQAGSRTCWGVPFLVSTVFTSGTPLVGNFQRGARLWVRSGVEILSGLNDDDFVKRRISLMATMRAAFKTIRPTAFTEVTGF